MADVMAMVEILHAMVLVVLYMFLQVRNHFQDCRVLSEGAHGTGLLYSFAISPKWILAQ